MGNGLELSKVRFKVLPHCSLAATLCITPVYGDCSDDRRSTTSPNNQFNHARKLETPWSVSC